MDKIFVELSQEQLVSLGITVSHTMSNYSQWEWQLDEDYAKGKITDFMFKSKKKYYQETFKELQELADILIEAQVAAQKEWKAF